MWITITRVVAGLGAVFLGLCFFYLVPSLFRLVRAVRAGTVQWPGPVVKDPNPVLSQAEELSGDKPRLFPSFVKFVVATGVAATFLGCVAFAFFERIVPSPESALPFYGVSTLIALVSGIISVRESGYRLPMIRTLLRRQ